MKQIRFLQSTAQGKVDGLMRFIGKDIFIKITNKQYLDAILNKLRAKGAIIQKGAHGEWIKIDIFKGEKFAKIGEFEMDLEEDSNKLIEENLAKFYIDQYRKGGFYVEMQNTEKDR